MLGPVAAPQPPAPTSPPLPPARPRESLSQLLSKVPLLPVAFAFTLGIVIDRLTAVALTTSLAAAAAVLAGWWVFGQRHTAGSYLLLLAGIMLAGMAYHHARQRSVPANDLRFQVPSDGTMARLKGVVAEPPRHEQPPRDAALRTYIFPGSTRLVVESHKLQQRGNWQEATGRVQVRLAEQRRDLNVGDEVELVGTLTLPPEPANPGEFDYAQYLRDEGIAAILRVPAAPGAVQTLRQGNAMDVQRWLARLRGWGLGVLERQLPEPQRGIAAALLLGDDSALDDDSWDQYVRSGVIHVLVISGQHLVIFGAFLWMIAGLLQLPRRGAALAIIALLIGYALMTGGRPPIMRAAVMAAIFTVAVFVHRAALSGNAFLLAWLAIALDNPAAIFNTGCQLSFLAVGMLMWGHFSLARLSYQLLGPLVSQPDPAAQRLQAVIDESRSATARVAQRLCQATLILYFECAIIWLAVMPLVAARTHVISPIAVLIGPPVMLCTTLALIAGLILLVSGGALFPVAYLLQVLLWACERLVSTTIDLPGASLFVPDVPGWWLATFYLMLIAGLTLLLAYSWARWLLWATSLWLLLGLVLCFYPARDKQFRCTFLAVGHGGCVIFETDGGKTIVYDAGAITGPEVTRRTIAPYLWSRGIRRIDELLISHGDLDHFNGVPALLERFRIDQVTLTPSFANRDTPGVDHTLRMFEHHGLPTRIVQRGQRWQTDGIDFEVLHPPASGPAGPENARSLVLAVAYHDLTLLLTGDLQSPGLEQVLDRPPRPVAVLQAPHHGSRTSNTAALAAWARPRFVISCQGAPRGVSNINPYDSFGARYLATWPHGAVTLRIDGPTFVVETHRSKNRWPLDAR